METSNTLSEQQINQLIVMIALATPLNRMTRFERMAKEFEFSIRNTSKEDLSSLCAYLAKDTGLALTRRVGNIFSLGMGLAKGTYREIEGAINASIKDDLPSHLSRRFTIGTEITKKAIRNGAKVCSDLYKDLSANPTEIAPKLLVLVLSSITASGGMDGNGGIPDTDIPLLGIGAHRSPLTHSIIIGSMLEGAITTLMRIVMCTHKNLPPSHDPLWDGLASRSIDLLGAAGKGASIGIAYHLMVDAVAQPGTYHGLPFDMPLEGHQTILGLNSVAEGSSLEAYPDETLIKATPEIIKHHKKFRTKTFYISEKTAQLLSDSEISILTKYGSWLEALAQYVIPPTTLSQIQFIKVANEECLPQTSYEKAWIAFIEAKTLADLG